jgi:Transposase DDE domain group 1
MDQAVRAAISGIDAPAWTPIKYPNALWDADAQAWVSDAEVAEVAYTAFTSLRRSDHVEARLIVRRVKRLNPASVGSEQGELFTAYRYHAVFTDSPMEMLDAETCHRGHAIVEQVIADLKDSALAHLPSRSFAANSAWLVCAAIAFNLTRAAGSLASRFHARATTATIRRQLITIPTRLARSARRLVLHLPQDWPWKHPWTELFTHACGPPGTAAH